MPFVVAVIRCYHLLLSFVVIIVFYCCHLLLLLSFVVIVNRHCCYYSYCCCCFHCHYILHLTYLDQLRISISGSYKYHSIVQVCQTARRHRLHSIIAKWHVGEGQEVEEEGERGGAGGGV